MPTAAEAMSYVNSQNTRKIKPVPDFLKNVAPVHIINIYNMPHTVRLGSFGSFYIPPCPAGKGYVDMTVPGFFADHYDLGDGQGNMSWNPYQGKDVAKNIVGMTSYSRDLSPMTTNLEWWGVAVIEGDTPTKEELAAARLKLGKFMDMWIEDGDKLALQGPKGVEQISEQHRIACTYRNLRRSWASAPEQQVDCPACGSAIKPGIVKCPHCQAILNKNAAKAFGFKSDEDEA